MDSVRWPPSATYKEPHNELEPGLGLWNWKNASLFWDACFKFSMPSKSVKSNSLQLLWSAAKCSISILAVRKPIIVIKLSINFFHWCKNCFTDVTLCCIVTVTSAVLLLRCSNHLLGLKLPVYSIIKILNSKFNFAL